MSDRPNSNQISHKGEPRKTPEDMTSSGKATRLPIYFVHSSHHISHHVPEYVQHGFASVSTRMFNSLYKLATFLLLTKVDTASPTLAEKSPALSSPQGSIDGSPPDDLTHKLLHYSDDHGPCHFEGVVKIYDGWGIGDTEATSDKKISCIYAQPDVAFGVCYDNRFREEHFDTRNVYTNADGNVAYHVPGSGTIIVYCQPGDGQRQHDARALALLRRNIPAAKPSDVACREHLPEDVTHRVL
jgi:hypothetical protein